MGYRGKVALQLKARELRQKGYSVKQIEKELGVSRSSVSIWCRDVKLSEAQLKKLYTSKLKGGLKGSYIASQNKQNRRKSEIKKLRREGIKQIGVVGDRDLFIAGIALYAAEGEKRDGTVGLSNSDHRIIKLFLRWIRSYCDISEERLRASLYLHDNLNEEAAKEYWSKATKIPKEQFCKTYFVKNKEDNFRKTKHEFGVFRVRISDVNLHRRIMGLIDGLLIDK